jgi:hypothetical protein
MSGEAPSMGDLPIAKPPHDTSTEKIHISMSQFGFKLNDSIVQSTKDRTFLRWFSYYNQSCKSNANV